MMFWRLSVDQTAFTRTTESRLRERLCLDRKPPDVIGQSGVSVGRRVPGSSSASCMPWTSTVSPLRSGDTTLATTHSAWKGNRILSLQVVIPANGLLLGSISINHNFVVDPLLANRGLFGFGHGCSPQATPLGAAGNGKSGTDFLQAVDCPAKALPRLRGQLADDQPGTRRPTETPDWPITSGRFLAKQSLPKP